MHAVDPHGVQFPRPPVPGLCGNKHKWNICATPYTQPIGAGVKRTWIFVASAALQTSKTASKKQNDPAMRRVTYRTDIREVLSCGYQMRNNHLDTTILLSA